MAKTRVTWKANEISDLIGLWGSPEFRDRIEVRNWKSSAGNKMAVFQEIAERLHRLGHGKKDRHHVQTKIKGLRATFKAVKDKMNKSGAGTDSLGEFEYFNEINNILGHRPNVNPSPLTIGDSSVIREVGLPGNRIPMPSGRRPASSSRISENGDDASEDSTSPVNFLRRPGSSCGSSGNGDDALPTFNGVPYQRGMIFGFEDWYAVDDAEEAAPLGTNSEGQNDEVGDDVLGTPESSNEVDAEEAEAADESMPETPVNAQPRGRKRRLPSGSKKDRTVEAVSKKIKETSDANWRRMSSMHERMRAEDRTDRVEELQIMRTLTSVLERSLQDRREERREQREEMMEDRRARGASMTQLLSMIHPQQPHHPYQYNNHYTQLQ